MVIIVAWFVWQTVHGQLRRSASAGHALTTRLQSEVERLQSLVDRLRHDLANERTQHVRCSPFRRCCLAGDVFR